MAGKQRQRKQKDKKAASARLITIASRVADFAWAGRLWGTKPVLVQVADSEDAKADDAAVFRIDSAQLAELERQCKYERYPLRIGAADAQAQEIASARQELDKIRAEARKEQTALVEIKAKSDELQKQLAEAEKALAEFKRQAAEANDARIAAETRAAAAESQTSQVQVEDLPDPDRKRG